MRQIHSFNNKMDKYDFFLTIENGLLVIIVKKNDIQFVKHTLTSENKVVFDDFVQTTDFETALKELCKGMESLLIHL